MTPYRRNALVSLICAALFTGLAVFLATTPYWPGLLTASYMVILLAWYARGQYGRHCRLVAEAEWWRRTKLGMRQAPLNPCCLPFDETGFLHDEVRCTRDRIPELWIEQARVEDEWNELVAGLGDLNQEEEA